MNSTLDIKVQDQSELPGLAESILRLYKNPKIILIYGPMGAGKTTLIKEICRSLGSSDSFSSPTFSIVNEYSYPNGKIFHFDLYRLKNAEELLDLGIEEYLHSDQYCIFEWPEMVENMININYKKIEIEVNENIRYIRIIKK
ncbi:MAG: tRNA (adenosine(37)-N6)-threonylcarbamoyltransferase complex ATPase subunit type 1 TsaE [Bacteroidetes bacterium]|nr:tRNA (adenosine(37)-N6)-threonylcarbamoyltransferase complex ATPase subunit type 1 TsaE [Bacteroidota bacterium]